MSSNSKSTKFSVEEILQYLSNKYGEEFTYLEPINANQPTATSFAIFVENENYPNKRIYAKCVASNNTDEKKFSDNFISFIYEDATRDLLTKITATVYPDAKFKYVLSDTAASSYSGENKLTFEEYLSHTSSSINYMILLPSNHDDSIYKEELEKLCELFKDNKVTCGVTIAYAKDDSQFESFITDSWTGEYAEYKLRGDIEIGENFEIEFEEWR